MSEDPRSDAGSNGSPYVQCNENVDISDNSSDSEKDSDIDAGGLHEALSGFISKHDLPYHLIFNDELFSEFLMIVYSKNVLKVGVSQLLEFIAVLFCKYAFPPKAIHDRFFREFFKVQISEATLRKECLDVYKQQKSKLKGIIGNMDGRVSVSIETLAHEGTDYDMFRQCCSCGPQYLCLKVHYIDDSWKRKKLVLDFYRLVDHGKMDLETIIKKSLSDWGIESKLSTLMITSSDFNSHEIFQSVKNQISEKSELQLNGRPLSRVFCCADLLNRMVQDAFEEIYYEILDISEISPWSKSEPLWYRTVSHLEEALDLESDGEFEKDMYKDWNVPSPARWEKVRGVHKLLEIVNSVAESLFDTKHSTAPMFFHGLLELQSDLTEETESCNEFVSKLAEKMLGKLKKYWSDMSLVLSIATVMDPRCKLKFVEFSLSKFKPDDQNSEIAVVQEAFQSLFNEYAARTVSEVEYPPSDLSSNEEEEDDDEEEDEDVYEWENEFEKFTGVSNQPEKAELVAYLEESVLPWTRNFSALSWWRSARHRYPILSKMAQEILAIPLSHATSDKAYFTCARRIDDHLCGLDQEMKIPMMCTHNWLKRETDPVAAALFAKRT